MDNHTEDQIPMNKEILLNTMNDLSTYINSINEQSQYYNLFNETLFQNNSKWLADVKSQIKDLLDNSNQNSEIIIKDINYDDKIEYLIKKIAEPQYHKILNVKNNNGNLVENKSGILEKVDELTNFSDIIGEMNSISKHKRNSLLSKIHKNDKNNNSDNYKINENNVNKNNVNENNKKINNNINNNFINYLNDEDINMNEYNEINQKEKIINNNLFQLNLNEEENENSLCTIEEQPSNEEIDKNTFSQNSNNLFNSKIISSSNQMNTQINNKLNNQNNENILNLSKHNNLNNESITQNIKLVHETDNKTNNKHIKILESTVTTPQKIENSLLTNSKNKHTKQDNLFYSQQKTPNFEKYNSNNRNENLSSNISTNSLIKRNDSQFSFHNTNKKLINNNNNINYNLINNENIFSTIKKYEKINLLDNNNNIFNNISNNKQIMHFNTQKKNNELNNINNTNTDNNSNKMNLIELLTNSINDQIIHNEQNDNIKFQNNIYSFTSNKKKLNNYNYNNSEIKPKNYEQKIVLSSIKKQNEINKNIKLNNIYENDFEEYEMSDISNDDDFEDDDESNNKFIPKWAKDKEYINNQIIKQNKDKNLMIKSFGNFIVENLNLNMIFETHNKDFEIRHSTADWRGEESITVNKVTNFNDKEIDKMFPNRKLEF